MTKMTSLAEYLNQIFTPGWIRKQARICGATKKKGKVDIVVLFWTVVLGPLNGLVTSLAELQRSFEKRAGLTLVSAGFQKRFSKNFAKFLRHAAEHVMAKTLKPHWTSKLLGGFTDTIAVDSTLVKVADTLASIFPGPRTNTSPAAIKVNAAYSLVSSTLRQIKIKAGKTGETKFLKIGRHLKGCLLLADLGYFHYAMFGRLHRVGGFFISRLKKKAKPIIVHDRQTGPGRPRDLTGLPLWEAVRGLHRDVLDVDVVVKYKEKRRATKGRSPKTVTRKELFRVVGVRHPETGEFHLYLTNIAAEQMSPHQIRVGYTGRWMVELVFDELKNTCGLKAFPSKRRVVVEAFIYAAILRLSVSRAVMKEIQRRFAVSVKSIYGAVKGATLADHLVERMPYQRFQIVWQEYAHELLLEVLKLARVPRGPLTAEHLLLHAAIDPNVSRCSLPRRIFRSDCDR